MVKVKKSLVPKTNAKKKMVKKKEVKLPKLTKEEKY